MRIYSLSKVISMPIILVLAWMAYQHYVNQVDMGYYLLIPIFLIVILYISYAHIDYWFHTKYPLPLDKEIIAWLERYSIYYKSLSPAEKEKYQYRMGLYLEAREFKSVGSEQRELPEDIKAIIATQALQMNFHQKDFLVGDFDRIFVYKHPFPTPRNKFLHSVETQGEDGVIIYSLEHLIPGIVEPSKYYNIGMHAYVEAFTKAYANAPFPYNLNAGWPEIEEISGLSKDHIMATLGYDSADLFVVLGTCYFTYPEKFGQKLPTLKREMEQLFMEYQAKKI